MKKSARVERVENGVFVIYENGITVRYNRQFVEKMIARSEDELKTWKDRLAKIDEEAGV